MSTALIHSRAQLGLRAPEVSVEVHLPNGLPGFTSTGITGGELRDRVKSAIQNSAFEFPAGRIVVNLGPAELPKSGGRYDLAIAAGILVASEQLPAVLLTNIDLLGELSLFGDIRPVRGALIAAREALSAGRKILCPTDNQQEFEGGSPSTSSDGIKLISHLNQLATIQGLPTPSSKPQRSTWRKSHPLHQVIGQDRAKRALTIAAAGGHHMLMSGPPGAGKTMLAERLRDLLPPLNPDSRAEVAEIYSLSGLRAPPGGNAPFRAPHHSASSAALTGGGSPPMPGEISYAHRGVLFMDEMPEFRRDLIEALREPMEAGRIRISRRGFAVAYPARFQLVAAMNPCPVGLACKPINCRCPPDQAQRYKNRISAPILDRIDLHIDVQPVALTSLLRQSPLQGAPKQEALGQETTGQQALERDCDTTEDAGSAGDTADRDTPPAEYLLAIERARQLQFERSQCLNAHLDPSQTQTWCRCTPQAIPLLKQAAERLELSARGYFRALRVARTITDLDAVGEGLFTKSDKSAGEKSMPHQPITEQAITEALGYRVLSS